MHPSSARLVQRSPQSQVLSGEIVNLESHGFVTYEDQRYLNTPMTEHFIPFAKLMPAKDKQKNKKKRFKPGQLVPQFDDS
jgi:hypothetical protein